jgi:putative transposase
MVGDCAGRKYWGRQGKRGTEVEGIIPDKVAVICLVGAILSEQHNEWQVDKRYSGARVIGEAGAAQ